MEYIRLREKIDSHHKDLRSLLYLFDMEGFSAILLKDTEQVEFLVHQVEMSTDVRTRAGAIEKLRQMVRKEMKIDATLDELRETARILCIKNYARMDKETLACAVEQWKNNSKKSLV